jgi:hypothetical protein
MTLIILTVLQTINIGVAAAGLLFGFTLVSAISIGLTLLINLGILHLMVEDI